MKEPRKLKASRAGRDVRWRKIRLLLVDDHPSVLAGVRGYLRSKKGLVVVGYTGSGVEAIGMAKALQPDVMIVDLNLPDVGGLDVIRTLRSGNEKVKFLVYSMHDGKEFHREANRAGVNGFVSKSAPLNKLASAIRCVMCGNTGSARMKPDTGRATGSRSRELNLTSREMRVLGLLVEGKVVKEIATDLSLSCCTVAHYVEHLYRKLEVHTRGEVVAKALKSNLVR